MSDDPPVPSPLRAIDGGKTDPAPELPSMGPITDPVSRMMAEETIRAVETGDPRAMVAMLRQGLDASPSEQARESPVIVALSVPIDTVDGVKTVGCRLGISFADNSPMIELEVGGRKCTVNGYQLLRTLNIAGPLLPPEYGPMPVPQGWIGPPGLPRRR